MKRSHIRVLEAISLFMLFWCLPQPAQAQESGRQQEIKGWTLLCDRRAQLKEEDARVYEITVSVQAGRDEEGNSSSEKALLKPEKQEEEQKQAAKNAQELSVTVRETLDPRFSLSREEEKRLEEAGAKIREKPDGSVLISWEVSFSGEEKFWSAGFSVQAREDFPGGNEVALFGEESGVYHNGRPLWKFPQCLVNVPFSLPLSRQSLTLFLGEKIPKTVKGKSLDIWMLGGAPVNWYGKGETGTLSLFWTKPDLTAVGSLSQLAEIRPAGDEQYAFSVSYTPYQTGSKGLGDPVEETEASASLQLNVIQGSLTVQAVSQGGEGPAPLFLLKSDQLTLYRLGEYRKTVEGKSLYQVDFLGLPFGKYRITQLSSAFEEISEEYWVGACPGNDTVDFQRAGVKTWMELTRKEERGEKRFETGFQTETFHIFPRDTLY